MPDTPVPPVMWLVPNYPWADDHVSGIFYRTQAMALARAGVELTVVAPTPWAPWPINRLQPRWDRYRRAPRVESTDGVTILRPRYPAPPQDLRVLAPDRAVASAAWRVRRAWRGAGLIHGHFSVAGIAAGRVARRAGVPYVLTMHGDDVNTWPDDRPEWRAPLIAALRGASAVISVSQALAGRVHQLAGVRATPLPLGIDHDAFRRASHGAREMVRQALAIPPTALVAVFIGNLQIAKGIHEFVEGVELAGGPVVGWVIGDGPERRSLEERSGDQIRWLGSLPNADVARHLAAADVLVLPSHGEGLPTVVVEAGSLGRAVIASRVGGIPELLEGGRGILLDEISPQAVSRALRHLVADPSVAEVTGDALRGHVEEHYDVDRNGLRLAEIYRAVVESGSRETGRPNGAPPE